MSIGAVLRHHYPQVLAKVVRRTQNLPQAEDALQTAVERALMHWSSSGIPNNPAGWLLSVSMRLVVDYHRHSAVVRNKAPELLYLQATTTLPSLDGWHDDALRLLVHCCEPALGFSERVALSLATVAGLSCAELAGVFRVETRTMEQRLVRARRRLRERGDPEAPEPGSISERLSSVLAVIQLIHTEGSWSQGESPIQQDLCRFALELVKAVVMVLPHEPEPMGLYAQLLFFKARLPARFDSAGPVPLDRQERSLWDKEIKQRGFDVLYAALSLGSPGCYQIEAAIAAVHMEAPTAETTDWAQIALLYDALVEFRSSPVVIVNRAFAVGMSGSVEEGLAILATVEHLPAIQKAPYAYLVKGTLLLELQRWNEAKIALTLAKARARNSAELRQIEARLDSLQS